MVHGLGDHAEPVSVMDHIGLALEEVYSPAGEACPNDQGSESSPYIEEGILMEVTKTMRLGVTWYPIPSEVEEPQRMEWLIDKTSELGLTCMSLRGPSVASAGPDRLQYLKELGEARNIEFEWGARGVWQLVGPDAKAGREEFLEALRVAKALGCTLIRRGYGQLTVATSRFNREIPIPEHLGHLIRNLKEAALMVEDSGVLLAIENHCDFTGREMAEVFAAVDSPSVGAAFDTGNAYTVFWDANDDAQALASYTMTTHMKDIKIIDYRQPGLVPFLPVGCPLGEGNVDFPKLIKAVAEQSPYAEGMHLVVENAFLPDVPGKTREEVRMDAMLKSISYLRELCEIS